MRKNNTNEDETKCSEINSSNQLRMENVIEELNTKCEEKEEQFKLN